MMGNSDRMGEDCVFDEKRKLTITPELYLSVRDRLSALGFRHEWEWAQTVTMPATPDDFAREYTWVVLNSGMKNTVARKIMDRVWPTIMAEQSASTVFGHKAKAAAIDRIWQWRDEIYNALLEAPDLVKFCQELPWIGPITCWHLAKNLGADVCKPDRWLVRLAEAEDTTPAALCERLAKQTGDRIATVDLILWRACVEGILAPKHRPD